MLHLVVAESVCPEISIKHMIKIKTPQMCISPHRTLYRQCIKMHWVSSEIFFSLIIQLKDKIWKITWQKTSVHVYLSFPPCILALLALEWCGMRNSLYSFPLLAALKKNLLGLAADGFIAREECASSWLPALYAWSSPSQCFMCLINCGTGRSMMLPKYMPFSSAKANIMKMKHLEIRSLYTVKICLWSNFLSFYWVNSE